MPARRSLTRATHRPLSSLALAGALWLTSAAVQAQAVVALDQLSLEELGDLPVTSVSGRSERWQDAPASVYVITGDDVRRSGATTLPQALRLAPNLQVAALNATQYAVSARGFNNAIANKLLVMVDGRTVYSPLFSGVLWDMQDMRLEDIDRIEVISGPGGTLWGANAVNGVINVVTRTAAATQGWQAAVGGGQGHEASVRYGGGLGDQGRFRVYALDRRADGTSRADGSSLSDATGKQQLGFRTDWADERRSLTVQGEAYEGGEAPGNNAAPVLRGQHLMARVGQRAAEGEEWALQAYVDNAERGEPVLFNDRTRTWDVRFDHSLPVIGNHHVLWGVNARKATSRTEATTFVLFMPTSQRLRSSSVYVQDEVRLAQDWQLTAGLKLERNRYTGWESMPNLRLAWRPSAHGMVWAGLSRAVRAPSRIDREFFLPAQAPFLITGGPDFVSEVAVVAEFGVRGRIGNDWSYSATVYRQQYDRLRGGVSGPTFIENRVSGHADGLEAWTSWQAAPAWRLSGGLLTQKKNLQAEAGTAATSIADLGNDPATQWSLRSSHNLGERHEVDVFLRRVGALPQPAIPAYTALDLRWGWRLHRQAELSLTVANAFDPRHAEFEADPSLQRRQVWLKLVLGETR